MSFENMLNREFIIKRDFTEIELNQKNILLYSVRSSIYKAICTYAEKFSGKLLDIGCGIMPYRELINDKSNITEYMRDRCC